MRQFTLIGLVLASLLFYACGDDDNDGDAMISPDYKITIHQPSEDDKHVNDSIHIHIDFESETNQTVHHINVRILNALDSTEVYNQPTAAHVHEEDGLLEFHDDFVLSNANGVMEHTDWILEAKVWGHELGLAEVIKTINFHVHP